jgi:hypothetical protein
MQLSAASLFVISSIIPFSIIAAAFSPSRPRSDRSQNKNAREMRIFQYLITSVAKFPGVFLLWEILIYS